jgi:hypothetical protein
MLLALALVELPVAVSAFRVADLSLLGSDGSCALPSG